MQNVLRITVVTEQNFSFSSAAPFVQVEKGTDCPYLPTNSVQIKVMSIYQRISRKLSEQALKICHNLICSR